MKNSELDGLVEWDITEKQKRFKILTLFGAEPQYHQGWKGIFLQSSAPNPCASRVRQNRLPKAMSEEMQSKGSFMV